MSFQHVDDYPEIPVSVGSTKTALFTGSWRSVRPVLVERTAPCSAGCPAGIGIPAYLDHIAADRLDAAFAAITERNPFPRITGRVCPHPCEASCNVPAAGEEPVSIRAIERWLGDATAHLPYPEPALPTGASVAVVGAGPAGLSAAFYLRRTGHDVVVFDRHDRPGGMLRHGIPDYRLPATVVEDEIARLEKMGIEFRTGTVLGRDLSVEDLEADFAAVLVATGAWRERSLHIPGAHLMRSGMSFLDAVSRDEAALPGRRCAVVGGGNTAMDAARSALRLGAASVRVVYRRTRDEMPAIPEEIDETLEEGVDIDFLTQPVALHEDPADGMRRQYGLQCVRMELGEPDESGRRAPVEIKDSDFELDCHRVILALGQSPDISVFPEGTEVREGTQLLGLLEKPLFAIGDLATREGTVAAAIGSGRRSAVHIHNVLSGEHVSITEHAEALRDVDEWRDEVIHADAMKLHLFERQAGAEGESLDPSERRSTFDEVHLGLEDASEAARCLSCGVCNECDLCITYCPEGVLKRVGHSLEFDYGYCKGCGMCVAECPRNVIFMSHL